MGLSIKWYDHRCTSRTASHSPVSSFNNSIWYSVSTYVFHVLCHWVDCYTHQITTTLPMMHLLYNQKQTTSFDLPCSTSIHSLHCSSNFSVPYVCRLDQKNFVYMYQLFIKKYPANLLCSVNLMGRCATSLAAIMYMQLQTMFHL